MSKTNPRSRQRLVNADVGWPKAPPPPARSRRPRRRGTDASSENLHRLPIQLGEGDLASIIRRSTNCTLWGRWCGIECRLCFSLSQLFYLTRTETGIPRLVMRLRTLQPIFASVFDWAKFGRGRRRPMIVLYLYIAVSTRLRREIVGTPLPANTPLLAIA